MYYVLAVVCGIVAGIVLDELFGAKVVSEVKCELHNVKIEILSEVQALRGAAKAAAQNQINKL